MNKWIAILSWCVLSLTCSLLAACTNRTNANLPGMTAAPLVTPATPQSGVDQSQPGLPQQLPTDYRQSWEELDAAGFVSAPGGANRVTNALTADSEFIPGVQRFAEDGDVSNLDQASSIGSGLVGAQEYSYALYRLVMGGVQPGVVAVDVNLHARNDGTLSDYWIGISDYAGAHWQWYGPLDDGQARISLPAGNYLSTLGNLFVAVVAYDGSSCDVVGIAANPTAAGDTTAPPAPTAPTLTPVAGGVLLEWLPVAAADLAGYQIYYGASPFVLTGDPGVKRLPYLEASRRFIIHQNGLIYVRIAAVDISGNASDLSAMASASALTGAPLQVVLTTDLVSGVLGDTATMTATGATSYDFDIDGDGVYDITGDVTGTAAIDTQRAGVIRPKVRANNGGMAVALGSVSLVIATQIAPVAAVLATPTGGVLWREPDAVIVTLDASLSYDEDGSTLEYSYDSRGDGSFTPFSANDTQVFNYTKGGIYLPAVRVRDADGLISYKSTLVVVKQVMGFNARDIDPFAQKGMYSSLALVDGKPAIALQDSPTGFLLFMRATDASGSLWGEPIVIDASSSCQYITLTVIDGHPAVSYFATGPGEVRYLRAADAEGQTWTNPPVNIEGLAGCIGTSVTDVNGNPGIAYVDSGANIVRYRRATSGAGTGDTVADWADAPFTVDNSGNIGGYPKLAVISGNAAIAYWDAPNQEVLYKRAVTATGGTSGDWPVLAARASPGGVITDGYVCLLEVGGRPAVSFHELAIGGLQYVRALNSTGSVTADWPIVAVQVATGGNSGVYNSLALVDGRPCLSYVTTLPWLGLFYSRATDADGTAFEPRVTVQSNPSVSIGYYSSLIELGGLPAIAYFNLTYNNIGFATPKFN